MKKHIPEEKIKKYLAGEASNNEKTEVESWYNAYAATQPAYPPSDLEGEGIRMFAAIEAATKPAYRPRMISRVSAAAACFLALAIGFLLLAKDKVFPGNHYANNISAAKKEGVLRFSDGRTIYLSALRKGESISDRGITLVREKNGDIVYSAVAGNKDTGQHEIITGKAEYLGVLLPDGTRVHLNAASSLKFDISIAAASSRNVELRGEGFFEVKHDSKHPFYVTTLTQKLMDIGTAFNINAYDPETVVTSMSEGKAQINGELLIHAGQRSILKKGIILMEKADLEKEMAWRKGLIILDNETFASIMEKISRWYGVDVVYEYQPRDLQLGGRISTSVNLISLLDALSASGKVHFRIEERRVTVTK
jgi:ferric-dicitrate binding protein FerR (iron transport regulator)